MFLIKEFQSSYPSTCHHLFTQKSTSAIPQPLPQTLEKSTEFNELQTSAPESGSEISDMVSSHELGIEVESLAHESNPDPPVLPECEHTPGRISCQSSAIDFTSHR
ncbi:hypothetical protein O181_108965, partial [Austropuccinia psidii MF-1]|nr:hypothetical protein [Austropuccinia psidii MF-1]